MARPRASDACISDVDFIFAQNRQHWSVTHPHTRSSVHKRKIASMAIDTHALSAERHCPLTRSPLCYLSHPLRSIPTSPQEKTRLRHRMTASSFLPCEPIRRFREIVNALFTSL